MTRKTELLEVSVDRVDANVDEITIRYTISNRADFPLYLLQGPRMPYIVPSASDDAPLEIVFGILPEEIDNLRLIPMFELPSTQVIEAHMMEPLKLSLPRRLSWSSHFSSASRRLEYSGNMRAILTVGYGKTPTSPVAIDSLKKFSEWQLLARSSVFLLPVA